jgi:hypothetical protein
MTEMIALPVETMNTIVRMLSLLPYGAVSGLMHQIDQTRVVISTSPPLTEDTADGGS